MKNACVVGCGKVSVVHIDALLLCSNANFYGVCDIDESKTRECLKEHQVKVFNSFDDVLADENIDCVHICTPHYLHTPMAIKALKAGKDVVLEKPAAISAEELETLKKAVDESGNRLCLMFQNRLNDSIVKLKEIVSGIDKTPEGVCGFLTWDRDADYYNSAEWRGTWSQEGGALMINQAIHLVDMIVYIGGAVDGIEAHISNKNLRGIIEAEDTAEMLMYFKSGMRGCFYASNAFTTSCPYRLEIVYDDVTYRYADGCLYEIKSDGDVNIIAKDNREYAGKACWGSSHAKEIEKFYSGEDYITLDSGYESMRVVLAMYESSKNNDAYIKL